MSHIYSNLLAVLDQQFIFKHRVSSRVKKLTVAFDRKTKENVVTLEFRVKVDDDHEDSLGDEDYDNVGPQMEAVRKERMDRVRREVVEPWNEECKRLQEKYPFLDDFTL